MSAFVWATEAIDARIVALRADRVSLAAMCPILKEEFGVSLNADQILRRTRVLGLPLLVSIAARREMIGPRVPVAPGAWTSPECDARLRVDWDAGMSHRQLAAKYKVCKSSLVRHAGALGFPERGGLPGQPAKPIATFKAPPQTRPIRSPSGRQGSALVFRGLATLPTGTVEHVAGRCAWPLSCSEPCDGRYCDEHKSLIRRAA